MGTKHEYIVVDPQTKHFVGSAGHMHREYPDAYKFFSLTTARRGAAMAELKEYEVYSVIGYSAGDPPVFFTKFYPQ